MRVIFEKDFNRRKDVLEWFTHSGQEILECFSIEKLNFLAKKHDELIIYVRKSESEAGPILRDFKNVILLSDDPLDDFKQEDFLLEASKKLSSVEGQDKTLDYILIGSSTGGLPVLQEIIKGLELKQSVVIICQHISKDHSQNVMDVLTKKVKKSVHLVSEKTELKKGKIYLLAGNNDYRLISRYGKVYIDSVGLSNELYHPSFNILTESMLQIKDQKSGCVILSGLGNDGSKYLKQLKLNNVKLVVQDPDTAVAHYMPKAAIATGVVDHVYTTQELHDFIKRSAA